MDALKLLEQQHQEVDGLFEKFEATDSDAEKKKIFERIADALAIHATIEEKFFYPRVRERQTERMVEESFDEHLEIKQLLVDALRAPNRPGFDGVVAALKGAVLHHVGEEENELFPKVRKLFAAEALEAIGQQLEAETAAMTEAGEARDLVEVEIEAPGPQP